MVRPTKRSKLMQEENEDALMKDAWEHYINYIDSIESDDDADGEVDELLEIIEILGPSSPIDVTSNNSAALELLADKTTFIPILLSMSYLHLANHSISCAMIDSTCNTNGQQDHNGFHSPQHCFEMALHYWHTNPAANLSFADYQRMNLCSSLDKISDLYGKASQYSKVWRKTSMACLATPIEDLPEESDDDINRCEMVELLILNGSLGVYSTQDNNDDDNSDGEEIKAKGHDTFSLSEVEATSSFMSALLLSTLGRHDEVLPFLKKFKFSHRIHPNVWKVAQSPDRLIHMQQEKDKDTKDSRHFFEPGVYRKKIKANDVSNRYDCRGILPHTLYKRLCDLFAPNALYWSQSDYNNRGYYSYYIDLKEISSETQSTQWHPTNIMEDVIVNYLLPLAQRKIKDICSTLQESNETYSQIVGAEWWCHTRPLGANLGHQLHFDTDEFLLQHEKKVTHPILSSVLYLTGGQNNESEHYDSTDSAGSTVIFDQTPYSTEIASKAWIGHPENNTYMIFPGSLLHGALPCAPKKGNSLRANNGQNANRLTFMVGFWTRNVTKSMGKHRKLYGSCGPLPPALEEHSWVIESQDGYEEDLMRKSRNAVCSSDESLETTYEVLPCISPAWEKIDINEKSNNTMSSALHEPMCREPLLPIPKSVDHQYFVYNPPSCFTESLFERDDVLLVGDES